VRVLVVEDQPKMRDVLCRGLRECGFAGDAIAAAHAGSVEVATADRGRGLAVTMRLPAPLAPTWYAIEVVLVDGAPRTGVRHRPAAGPHADAVGPPPLR
jgi:CheY-like chemotaxis protein